MQILITVLQVLLFLVSPILIRQLAARTALFSALGPVVTGYVLGIGWRNAQLIGLDMIPGDSAQFNSVSEITFALAIVLAIPLMLFATDFRSWLQYAPKSALAFAVSCFCITTVGALVTHLIGYTVPEGWKVACMLVGSFTGGSPNFAAIGMALETRKDIFIIANTTELLSSAVYLLLILNFGKRLLGKILPPFQMDEGYAKLLAEISSEPVTKRIAIRGGLLSLAVLVVSIGGGTAIRLILTKLGVTPEVVKQLELPLMVMLATTLGILLSFFPAVRRLKNVDQVGEYAILIFCFAFGTLVDATSLNFDNTIYFLIAFLILIITLPTYYLICYILKIDVDTAITVSAACVFSPPFIPMIAENLKNKAMLLTGMTTGIAGYAVGNYLGLGLAFLLRP